MAISVGEGWRTAYSVAADGHSAAAEVLRGLRDTISDWEDGADD
jgi:hypothetical protein